MPNLTIVEFGRSIFESRPLSDFAATAHLSERMSDMKAARNAPSILEYQ